MVFEPLKSQAEWQFTAQQIAEQVFADYLACCQAREKTSSHLHTDKDVMIQLAAEIGAHRPALQKKHPSSRRLPDAPKSSITQTKRMRPKRNSQKHHRDFPVTD